MHSFNPCHDGEEPSWGEVSGWGMRKGSQEMAGEMEVGWAGLRAVPHGSFLEPLQHHSPDLETLDVSIAMSSRGRPAAPTWVITSWRLFQRLPRILSLTVSPPGWGTAWTQQLICCGAGPCVSWEMSVTHPSLREVSPFGRSWLSWVWGRQEDPGVKQGALGCAVSVWYIRLAITVCPKPVY